jgi:hypothetical protein
MTWKKINVVANQHLVNQLNPANAYDGLDPHLIWAGLTYFEQHQSYSTRPIPVMFEAKLNPDGTVCLPDSCLVTLIEGTKHFCDPFFTGFVKLQDLHAFGASVRRFRIGVVALPSTQNIRCSTPITVMPRHANPQELVIGLIDHGVAFANRQFATPTASGWASRIERLWDQQNGYPVPPVDYKDPNPPQPTWTSVPHYGYGRELGDAQINFWLNRNLGDAEIYRRLQYQPVQGARAHGTHVLGLAAGTQAFGFGRGLPPVGPLNDAASSAKIIAVQLPARPYKDTSGAGLCVQILDAISYIALHAAGRKIVFNLSDGAYAGPHDGSSLLERALDQAFASNRDRHALVVAAGNQFDERVHWKAAVPAKGAAEPIAWHILPDDRTDSHLEIWPAADTPQGALNSLQVSVTPPGGSASPAVALGDVWALCNQANRANRAFAAVIFAKNPPNGFVAPPVGGLPLGRGMIHIAVAATRPPRRTGRDAAPYGIWKIELINTGDVPIQFDAYIERDNPALGDAGPRRQSHFVHASYPRDQRSKTPALDDAGNLSPVKRMGALNSVATAGQVLVVGGYIRQSGQLAPYSASGPGRSPAALPGIDILAVSENSQHVKGVRSTGVRTGTTFRMDGTSVAAPLVSRWVVNWMATGVSPPGLRGAIGAAASTAPPVAGPIERVGVGRL